MMYNMYIPPSDMRDTFSALLKEKNVQEEEDCFLGVNQRAAPNCCNLPNCSSTRPVAGDYPLENSS